eukprot:6175320-Pleurochrysis_carterae.AAC.1
MRAYQHKQHQSFQRPYSPSVGAHASLWTRKHTLHLAACHLLPSFVDKCFAGCAFSASIDRYDNGERWLHHREEFVDTAHNKVASAPGLMRPGFRAIHANAIARQGQLHAQLQ